MDLRTAVVTALKSALADKADSMDDLSRMLTTPPRAEMGEVAFGCFGLARIFKKAPVEIAAELAPRIEVGGMILRAEAAGPYVNFTADPVALLDWTSRAIASQQLFDQAKVTTPSRMMVEFSQPNTHKTFHVGHLRNVALGDAMVRIFRACGHDVVPVNYYGDYGLDVAKCLWWLQTHPNDLAPESGRAAWLGAAYSSANALLKRDADDSEQVRQEKADRFELVRSVLAGIDGSDPKLTALYQQTRQWCLDDFQSVYDWLGVQFDHDFFESELEGPANALVETFLEKGVFVESDGAIVCHLTPKIKTPAMVRKSDGTSLYMTWDLSLASAKFDGFGIERSLYVVGTEQTFHFKQLFATLERMGYERAKDCRHISYELVMLPEGKMSSRDGTAIPLDKLKQSVCEAIAARVDSADRLDPSEREETIRRISVACLKYGMLRIGNNKSVIFNLDDWISPEGDTGAYLLYSLARMAGVFRKAGGAVDLSAGLDAGEGLGEPAERALLRHLLQFPTVVSRSAETCDPSAVAGFAYETARLFSRFYSNCPILTAEGSLREARLVLTRATEVVLIRALSLLGIQPVSAM